MFSRWLERSGRAYTWTAQYEDGTAVAEDELGTFEAVDKARCVAVRLAPTRAGLPSVEMRVDPTRGQRAVFLRRHQIAIDPQGKRPAQRSVVTCLGWENGHSAVYQWFFEDGRVLLTSDFQAV